MLRTIRSAISMVIALSLAHVSFGQPGSLDPTFDADGVRQFNESWGIRWYGTLLLPDTTAVLYGEHWITGSHCEACFTHILQDGSTDMDWGTNGVTYIDAGSYASAYCMVRSDDGSYFAGGEYDDGVWPVNNTGILFHLLADGTPDPAFGGTGVVIREEIGFIRSIRQWDADRLLMSGGAGFGESFTWLMRCGTDGSLDTTFSQDGLVGDTATSMHLMATTVLDDRSIVGGGSIDLAWPLAQSVFVRVDSTGEPIPGFGSNGVLLGDFISPEGRVYDLASMGGSIIATGVTSNTSTNLDSYLLKLGDDGALDPVFNGGTVALIDRDTLDYVQSLIVDPAGRILICGSVGSTVDDCLPMVSRYLPSGAVDTTFGDAGVITVAMPGGYTTAMGMAWQPDEKVLVAGYAATTPYGFAFRILGDGELPEVLPEHGAEAIGIFPNPVEEVLHIDLPGTWAARFSVEVIDATGRVVLATSALRTSAFNMNGLAPGAYLLSVSDGEDRAVQRFIKR